MAEACYFIQRQEKIRKNLTFFFFAHGKETQHASEWNTEGRKNLNQL